MDFHASQNVCQLEFCANKKEVSEFETLGGFCKLCHKYFPLPLLLGKGR